MTWLRMLSILKLKFCCCFLTSVRVRVGRTFHIIRRRYPCVAQWLSKDWLSAPDRSPEDQMNFHHIWRFGRPTQCRAANKFLIVQYLLLLTVPVTHGVFEIFLVLAHGVAQSISLACFYLVSIGASKQTRDFKWILLTNVISQARQREPTRPTVWVGIKQQRF